MPVHACMHVRMRRAASLLRLLVPVLVTVLTKRTVRHHACVAPWAFARLQNTHTQQSEEVDRCSEHGCSCTVDVCSTGCCSVAVYSAGWGPCLNHTTAT
jgi:hypothetical protein